MGYSCAAKAAYVQDELIKQLQTGPGYVNSSNTWLVDGVQYFFERGLEQDDGSITGSVWGPSKTHGPGYAHKVGGYKINANGVIERFPTSTKTQRLNAQRDGLNKYYEIHEPHNSAVTNTEVG